MTLSSAAHTCRYSKHSTPLQNKTRYLYPNKAIYVLIKIEQFNHDGLELIRWLFFRLYLWVRVLHVIIIQTLHSEKEVVVKKPNRYMALDSNDSCCLSENILPSPIIGVMLEQATGKASVPLGSRFYWRNLGLFCFTIGLFGQNEQSLYWP